MDQAYNSVQNILYDNLDLRQCCNTSVPHHLITEHMTTRVKLSSYFFFLKLSKSFSKFFYFFFSKMF